MPKRERYVFICVNDRPPDHPRGSCAERGAPELVDQFELLIMEHDLVDEVRLIRTSCLDACEVGVTVAVYPDDVWYGRISMEDLEEIVERHLAGGEPVERLTLGPEDFE
jgi:(2Fe-2S) ferredoxin